MPACAYSPIPTTTMAEPPKDQMDRTSVRSSEEAIIGADNDTIIEKKCMLINRQLDAFGMGKYQWSIWVLCGFGYLIDLLWAQAFGLVLGPVQQELGFPGRYLNSLSRLSLLINQHRRSIRQYQRCLFRRTHGRRIHLGCIGGYHWSVLWPFALLRVECS